METKESKVSFTVQIPEGLHLRTKKFCRKNKITMYEFMEALLNKTLTENDASRKLIKEYLKENS